MEPSDTSPPKSSAEKKPFDTKKWTKITVSAGFMVLGLWMFVEYIASQLKWTQLIGGFFGLIVFNIAHSYLQDFIFGPVDEEPASIDK